MRLVLWGGRGDLSSGMRGHRENSERNWFLHERQRDVQSIARLRPLRVLLQKKPYEGSGWLFQEAFLNALLKVHLWNPPIKVSPTGHHPRCRSSVLSPKVPTVPTLPQPIVPWCYPIIPAPSHRKRFPKVRSVLVSRF